MGFIILKARAAGLEKEAGNMGRRGWRMSGGGGGGGDVVGRSSIIKAGDLILWGIS